MVGMKAIAIRQKKQKDRVTAEEIISNLHGDISEADKELIKKACEYAKKHHDGQTRYSGTPLLHACL